MSDQSYPGYYCRIDFAKTDLTASFAFPGERGMELAVDIADQLVDKLAAGLGFKIKGWTLYFCEGARSIREKVWEHPSDE